MAKTITSSQLIGARGESLVGARANAMGFMYSRYGPPEAGLDGLLEMRDPQTGRATGQLVAVQVKTKESGSYTAETESGFQFLMDEEDLGYWQGCSLPVIVVLVHLEREEYYWKSVDAGTGDAARRLSIDKTKDVFDVSARDAIADLCVAKGGYGVWFPPYKSGENGHLNLLEVALPDYGYVAASPFKSGRQALWELLDHDDRPPDDWVIRGGQFLSFRDPREGPLAHIVDVGSVEPIASEEIAFPDDEVDERNVIELLRRTLGVQVEGLLAYSRAQRAFYFPALPEAIERNFAYRSHKVDTSAAVVKKYEKEGKLNYVRHHAFEPRFWRIGEEWFLSVTPTFVFTWDGFRPDKFASSRLTGKKQREHNSALVGQFAMWRFLLTGCGRKCDRNTLFELERDGDAILSFTPVEPLHLTRGVPDDLWRKGESDEPEDTGQGRLLV